MKSKTQRAQRRSDALSKERIVEAAIEILDASGESALTFRVLAAHLTTGSGAIYWHVTDKNDLLAAATEGVISRVMAGVTSDVKPREAIRIMALGLFDTFDSHPWVGAQLFREPWQPAMLQILEGIGGRLQALGVPERSQFDAWSALVNYILGVAGQNAANARLLPGATDRAVFLGQVAAQWEQLDPTEFSFLPQVAAQIHGHDDREQFLAGIDLILIGIGTAE